MMAAIVCRFMHRACFITHPAKDDFSLPSLPHRLDHHPLSSLAVEFGIVDLLPGAEVQPAFGDGDDDLVMHEQAFQVGVAVDLAGAVMVIIRSLGRQLLQPFLDVADQPGFGVVDINRGGDVHRL